MFKIYFNFKYTHMESVLTDLRCATRVAIGVGVGLYLGMFFALRSRRLAGALRFDGVPVRETVGLQLGDNLDHLLNHLRLRWGFRGVEVVEQ